MSREDKLALTLLAIMAFTVGVFLYLAVAVDEAPGTGVWIALLASLMAAGIALSQNFGLSSETHSICNKH